MEDREEVLPGTSLDIMTSSMRVAPRARLVPPNLAWRVFLAWHNASQRIHGRRARRRLTTFLEMTVADRPFGLREISSHFGAYISKRS